jgi:hypothetical protein
MLCFLLDDACAEGAPMGKRGLIVCWVMGGHREARSSEARLRLEDCRLRIALEGLGEIGGLEGAQSFDNTPIEGIMNMTSEIGFSSDPIQRCTARNGGI